MATETFMARLSMIMAASVMLALTIGPALADPVIKTWVSSTTGNDTGTCNFIAPCKTFAYAITQTAPGGELNVKDSGSYGPVTITQAISIVSKGFVAQIGVPPGATGITINNNGQDNVVLQGLLIDGHGLGKDGIDFNSGPSITIEDCHIRNVTNIGLNIQSVENNAYYGIKDTDVANAAAGAIQITTPGGLISSGVLSRVALHGSQFGLSVNNSNAELTGSAIIANTTGIYVGSQTNVWLGKSTVMANGTGIINAAGILNTYGDNYIDINGTDISGALTGLQKQ